MTKKDYLGISLIVSVLVCILELLWYFHSKDEAMIMGMFLQFFPISILGTLTLISEE